MALTYKSILWNRQKKRYDLIMWGIMLLYLGIFTGSQFVFFPTISPEALIIRSTGTLAILMLHVILVIGPLARISPKFLPLLYNRRHMGVSMFLIASVHAGLSLLQFHGFSSTSPLVALFTSNPRFDSISQFPFQTFGFFALLILFFMAVSSHDFWLKNLSPYVWKTLHMLVYLAYLLLIFHIALGVLQQESTSIYMYILGLGVFLVVVLHIVAAVRSPKSMLKDLPRDSEGFVKVCTLDEIELDCAKVILVDGENIAIFKYDGKLSAINNVCKHQNGPLGEGKVIDGCVTCPWHGYQYLPENGSSPPPFKEKVSTYDVKLLGNTVWVNPTPHPEGTMRPPTIIPN
ncbi:MAG: Rieske 2Fe-2S domain-containing protein [Bacteroidota bacterium]